MPKPCLCALKSRCSRSKAPDCLERQFGEEVDFLHRLKFDINQPFKLSRAEQPRIVRTYVLTSVRNCGFKRSLPGMKPVTKAATAGRWHADQGSGASGLERFGASAAPPEPLEDVEFKETSISELQKQAWINQDRKNCFWFSETSGLRKDRGMQLTREQFEQIQASQRCRCRQLSRF